MRPALSVLFVTGYAENAAVDGDQLETGMAVLLKPFGINNFTHKVAEILALGFAHINAQTEATTVPND
jgi:hypothetical protein